jgi:hypothetical protein
VVTELANRGEAALARAAAGDGNQTHILPPPLERRAASA